MTATAGDGPAGMTVGELAHRLGVSTDILRAWERRYHLFTPTRSSGGYRLYSAEDERRGRQVMSLRHQGLPTARAVAEVLRHPRPSAGPERLEATPYLAQLDVAVREMDEPRLRNALDDTLSRAGIALTTRDVVIPFLVRLGEQWECGDLSTAHEHFASHVLRGWLTSSALRDAPRSGTRSAVLACPPGERHELGLLVYAVLLTHAGWGVRFLGADTPLAAMATACRVTDADALVVTSIRPQVLESHALGLRQLGLQRRLVIGGAGATPAIASRLGAQLLTSDILNSLAALDDAVGYGVP